MLAGNPLPALREESRAFEQGIPVHDRKARGQFFTGHKVGRVLSHLALDDSIERVLDPMAGTGDLLDAFVEASASRGKPVRQVDAIDVNAASAALCRRRLGVLAAHDRLRCRVLCADAFDVGTYTRLDDRGYDLVIANPPYVRYQSLGERAEATRRGLLQVIARHLRGSTGELWNALATGYSGLADLSVPAWLLCALLARPGGRLALVAPATWLTRDYAHVLRYLMLRAYQLELVVEDRRRCWFPDALVGTHLVVARRLPDSDVETRLNRRTAWQSALWVTVDAAAASTASVVGKAFRTTNPEREFAHWCRDIDRTAVPNITWRAFSLRREWLALTSRARPVRWLSEVEPAEPPLRTTASARSEGSLASLPGAIAESLPPGFLADRLVPINALGIHVGQGLRTGCNRFFYVRLLESVNDAWAIVVTHSTFGPRTRSA